jgi:hypothetical protein
MSLISDTTNGPNRHFWYLYISVCSISWCLPRDGTKGAWVDFFNGTDIFWARLAILFYYQSFIRDRKKNARFIHSKSSYLYYCTCTLSHSNTYFTFYAHWQFPAKENTNDCAALNVSTRTTLQRICVKPAISLRQHRKEKPSQPKSIFFLHLKSNNIECATWILSLYFIRLYYIYIYNNIIILLS